MPQVGRPSLSLIHTGFLLAVVLLPGEREFIEHLLFSAFLHNFYEIIVSVIVTSLGPMKIKDYVHVLFLIYQPSANVWKGRVAYGIVVVVHKSLSMQLSKSNAFYVPMQYLGHLLHFISYWFPIVQFFFPINQTHTLCFLIIWLLFHAFVLMSRHLDPSLFEILFKACGNMYINLWHINSQRHDYCRPSWHGKLMEEVTWKYFKIFPRS